MPVTTKVVQFTVESYDVSISQGSDGIRRIINLLSTDQSHGIRFKVKILFWKTNFIAPSVGQINNLDGANFNARELMAWGDNALFDSFYATLSTESPVTFEFTYGIDSQNPKEDPKDVQSYRLFTGKEVPGDFEKTFTVFSKLGN